MTISRLRPFAALLLVAMVATAGCNSSTDTAAAPGGDSSEVATGAESATEAGDPNVSPQAGETTAGKYNSQYFGFSMNFPEAWAVAPQETTEELQKAGSEVVAGDDPALKSSLEAAEKNTHQLLMISEQPVGTPVQAFNPNVVVMAEKVSHLPGIKSGNEYLQNVSALLQQTELPYQPAGEPYAVEINGREFYRADFTLEASGMQIKQSYLATVDKGYALGFILSGTDESLTQLDEIANSVTF